MPHDGSDGTYARQVQDGNRDAFRVLIDRYEGMVFDLTHQYADQPEDAEDLAQDIFLKAFDRIDRLRKPDRFASWLYGIAINHCRDYAKNARRETYAFARTEQEDSEVVDTNELAQDEELIANEHGEQLWAALEELSSSYATAFLLKYRDGLTYKAMSKRLDASVSALKVRVHRARKKLRKILEPYHDESRA